MSHCVCAYVGVLLPYEDGTFAAELFLVFITGITAAIQIRIGLLLTTSCLSFLPGMHVHKPV